MFSELRSCLDDDEMRSAGWCAPLIWVAGYLARNSAKLILLLYTTLTICTHEKKVSDPKYFDINVISDNLFGFIQRAMQLTVNTLQGKRYFMLKIRMHYVNEGKQSVLVRETQIMKNPFKFLACCWQKKTRIVDFI